MDHEWPEHFIISKTNENFWMEDSNRTRIMLWNTTESSFTLGNHLSVIIFTNNKKEEDPVKTEACKKAKVPKKSRHKLKYVLFSEGWWNIRNFLLSFKVCLDHLI